MKSFLIVIERGDSNYSSYCLDDIACIATGATIDETLQLMHEGIALWVEATLEQGGSIPEPKDIRFYIDSGEWNFAPDGILAHVAVHIPELA
jgi:predicted RNase H-like HicB family nuclease